MTSDYKQYQKNEIKKIVFNLKKVKNKKLKKTLTKNLLNIINL